jgi:hypothetical protein
MLFLSTGVGSATRMPVNKDKTVRTSVIVPSVIYEHVQKLAADNDVSAAWLIRHALLEFLARHQGEKTIPLRESRKPPG